MGRNNDFDNNLYPPKAQYNRVLMEIADALVLSFGGTTNGAESVTGLFPQTKRFIDALNRIKRAIETATVGGGGGGGIDTTARNMASAETARAQAAESLIDTLLRESNVVTFVYNPAARAFMIFRSNGNNVQLTMPTASGTVDGLMSKESYGVLQTLVSEMATLSDTALVPIGSLGVDTTVFNAMTQAQKNAQVTADTGVSNFGSNDAVKDLSNVTWLFTSAGWVKWGTASFLAAATNSSVGVVRGVATGDGKIFIEADGSMSLIGWDALASHIASTTVHVSAGEKAIWNGKQDALPAGGGPGEFLSKTSGGALAWVFSGSDVTYTRVAL